MQTDTYGDIPLEYYIKGAAPVSEQVSYTKQEDVYAAISICWIRLSQN